MGEQFLQNGQSSHLNQQEKEQQIEQKQFNLSIHTQVHSLEDKEEILLSQEVFEEYFNFN